MIFRLVRGKIKYLIMKIKTIKEFIPTFTSSFVILGIIKAMIYYYAFGIRILDYIDFSESLLLFFDDIILIIGPILIAYIGNLYIIKQLKEAEKINKKRFQQIAIVLSLVFIIMNPLYVYLILHKFFHFSIGSSLSLASGVLLISGFYFFSTSIQMEEDIENINNEIEPRRKKILKDVLFYKIGLVLSLYLVINGFIYRTHKDFDNAISKEPEKQVICILKDSSIISSGKDTLYLGQTHNNVFFHIRSTKTSIIIKIDDIKNIKTRILKSQQPPLFFNF